MSRLLVINVFLFLGMRNLAMSCAIVSLILLGTSAPLGILGLIKKQISTIMVTGVMYILAGTFYKRNIPCFIQFVFFAICIRRKLAVKSILQNIIQKKATVENALVCRKKLAFFRKILIVFIA